MSQPINDAQFASFDLDPTLARVFNAAYGINIPPPPRTDLLPLVIYAPPIAAPGTPAGPIADLLRLNTGVPPTPLANRKRLGLIAGDGAGFPNGRRLTDDVVDIAARAVAGVLNPKFNVAPNNLIGDGVAATDVPTQETSRMCTSLTAAAIAVTSIPVRRVAAISQRSKAAIRPILRPQTRAVAPPALSCNSQTCRRFPAHHSGCAGGLRFRERPVMKLASAIFLIAVSVAAGQRSPADHSG